MSDSSTLVFCPTHQVQGQDQVRPETLAAIEAMAGDFDFILGKFNPYSVGHMNILNQYQVARGLVLDGSYTHLLTIEHDMLPPRGALVKLLATGAQVAYGVYLLRHGAKVLNAWRKVRAAHVGMSLSLFKDELAAARAQVVAEVSGVGMGCTLIARSVLELFDFHAAENAVSSSVPDVAFATDCLRANIKQVAHFEVLCGHIEPNGQVLWPFGKGDHAMVEMLVLKSVNAPGGLVLTEGEIVEIPAAVASELGRAGYVTEPPKAKGKPAAKAAEAEKEVVKPVAKKGLSTKSTKPKK